MKLLVNESQKFDIKYHEDYMGALFVNKETIKQVVLLYRPAIGWTTKYINILCILIYITLSSSLGWTIGTNNIMKSFKLF